MLVWNTPKAQALYNRCMVTIKRIYEESAKEDGYRVLVDRLWPRGVSKEKAACDEWLKDVGPSNNLRKWFGHKPEHFAEFSKRYHEELKHNPAFKRLQDIAESHEYLTLLYAARDEQYNEARVLCDLLLVRSV
jgi:uncharacterized protein YeaO (DUF488 family)